MAASRLCLNGRFGLVCQRFALLPRLGDLRLIRLQWLVTSCYVALRFAAGGGSSRGPVMRGRLRERIAPRLHGRSSPAGKHCSRGRWLSEAHRKARACGEILLLQVWMTLGV